MTTNTNLMPYILRFGLAYFIALIIVDTIMIVFDINSSAFSSSTLIAGLFAATHKFVTDEKRVPTGSEKVKMAFGSLAISYLISIVVMVAFIAWEGEELYNELLALFSENTTILLVVLTLVSLFFFGLLVLGYGFVSKMQLKNLEKQK